MAMDWCELAFQWCHAVGTVFQVFSVGKTLWPCLTGRNSTTSFLPTANHPHFTAANRGADTLLRQSRIIEEWPRRFTKISLAKRLKGAASGVVF